MIGRDEVLRIVRERVPNPSLVKHMLATEAVMRALAARLGEDPDLWAMTGLLHDVDLGETGGDPERHGRAAFEMLAALDVPEELRRAVLVHAGHAEPASRLDRAIRVVDPTTGLVTAAALVTPAKKPAGVTVQGLLKRMKEKRFAANVDREAIRACEELGIGLDEFLGLALGAMQRIADDLDP